MCLRGAGDGVAAHSRKLVLVCVLCVCVCVCERERERERERAATTPAKKLLTLARLSWSASWCCVRCRMESVGFRGGGLGCRVEVQGIGWRG